jgi:hypothetical protein
VPLIVAAGASPDIKKMVEAIGVKMDGLLEGGAENRRERPVKFLLLINESGHEVKLKKASVKRNFIMNDLGCQFSPSSQKITMKEKI